MVPLPKKPRQTRKRGHADTEDRVCAPAFPGSFRFHLVELSQTCQTTFTTRRPEDRFAGCTTPDISPRTYLHTECDLLQLVSQERTAGAAAIDLPTHHAVALLRMVLLHGILVPWLAFIQSEKPPVKTSFAMSIINTITPRVLADLVKSVGSSLGPHVLFAKTASKKPFSFVSFGPATPEQQKQCVLSADSLQALIVRMSREVLARRDNLGEQIYDRGINKRLHLLMSYAGLLETVPTETCAGVRASD